MCSRCDDIFGLIEYQTVMLAKSEIMLMFAVVSQTLRGFNKLVVLVRSMTQHPSGSLVLKIGMILPQHYTIDGLAMIQLSQQNLFRARATTGSMISSFFDGGSFS